MRSIELSPRPSSRHRCRVLFRFGFTAVLVASSTVATAFAAPPEPPQPTSPRTFAVRPPSSPSEADTAAAFEARLAEGAFVRFVMPRTPDIGLEVGEDATGEVEIWTATLPVGPAIRQRLSGLPVDLGAGGPAVGGQAYGRSVAGIAVRLPGSTKRDWVIAGQDVSEIAAMVDRVLLAEVGVRSSGDAEPFDFWVYESSYLSRLGRWRQAQTGWATDPDAERDQIAERAAYHAALRELGGSSVRVRVPPAMSTASWTGPWVRALDASATAMARRAGVDLDRPVEVVTYPDFVVQGQYIGAVGAAVTDLDAKVHVVPHPHDLDVHRWGVARAIAQRAGVPGDRPWLLDGAALWLSDRWYGRDRRDWLPMIRSAGLVPDAETLWATERQGDGSEVLWPVVVAAALDGLPGERLRDRLESGFDEARLDAVLRRLQEEPSETLPLRVSKRRPVGFFAGVSLAHTPGLEVGYQAPTVDQQLGRLVGLGVDAVALMPFALQRRFDQPTMRYLNKSPGSENDAGMIHVARLAQARGMRILWKPHVYVGGGSWPGDVAMTKPSEWQAWWLAYRRYVLHQAVLAAWSGADAFAVGVELGKTVDQEAEWRALIELVRSVFPGLVTYAGNWWGDYDRVPFWDALDLIGVDAYFPLSSEAQATDEALLAGARRAVEELRQASVRFGKPVILAETGFAARDGAWIAPHEEGGNHSDQAQARAYSAWLAALGRPSWLNGIFFWKVYSHPSQPGNLQPDFQFLDRQAESVVRRYLAPVVEPVAVGSEHPDP